ncbi:DNA-binding CsgD family transcriptional regulator [Litorivivens lipolytica]|uniref:DNA-binding CsgD family transcriptional regulator n=1 Tax=Litorivivens lipolytica TaxID=1524264 RepID=A0A7W4W601_9GAMM|nr:helix-turn-helix transcriptional regulator [Litorivivens lipolytica]MBB3048055.1 DNA-binding CsgD family transcriptional regulator [Litorivivens lipolytica]
MDQREQELIEAIYEAPLTEPVWSHCLKTLRLSLNAQGAVLLLRLPSEQERGVILADGIPGLEGEIGDNPYSKQFYSMDPFVNIPDNITVTLDEHLDMDDLVTSEFYQLSLEPFGIYHIAGIELTSGGDIDASLRLTRHKGEPGFNQEERELLNRLIPHLKRALRIHSRLESVSSEKELYAQAVSQLAVATYFLNDKGHLIEANPMGERLLEADRGLSISAGKLVLERSVDTQKLKTAIDAALKARLRGDTVFAQAMPVYDHSGDCQLGLTVRPLAIKRHRETDNEAVIAIFVSDANARVEAPQTSLTQLFGLTPAESRLATALANGLSLDDASASLHISRNTARAHLRSIFSKTGVNQQTQLVSLILKSVAPLG